MIVITGGTGKLGSQVVDQLLRRVPAGRDRRQRPRRRPRGRARRTRRTRAARRLRRSGFARRGVRGRVAGPRRLDGPERRDRGSAHHVAAIEAAREAGVKRVLYTSHQAAAEDSLFAPMPDHAATERHLAASDTPFTALRNGFYASTVPLLLGQALETGELVAPADGPVSWTAHADLAEAAAVVLAAEGRFDGPTPPLTAPVALDLEDVAGILDRAHRPHDPPGRRRRRRVGGRPDRARRPRGPGGDAARHVPRGPPGRVRRHRS